MPQHLRPFGLSIATWLLVPALLLGSSGCSSESAPGARAGAESEERLPTIYIAIAETGGQVTSYAGATSPVQTVALRARVEGQILSLNADIGDRVERDRAIAELDRETLLAAASQAEAELAARQFEVEQAKSQLAEARTQVERANVELQQARADAARLDRLAREGAISAQDGEIAQTALRTAEQALKTAQEQVKTRERAIATAERRAAAQAAIAAQETEELSYATLESPLTGVVLSRSVDPGDLVQPGQVLLEIGDLSTLHVSIQVSDRDLARFALGQEVSVSLDAFPNRTLDGKVTRISPVADAAARLIPVEITIPNSDGKIGSGLLARVAVVADRTQPPTIPERALNEVAGDSAVVFVPQSNSPETIVTARSVRLGARDNGRVEILSGLELGEAFVLESDRPLEAGQTARRSVLSN